MAVAAEVAVAAVAVGAGADMRVLPLPTITQESNHMKNTQFSIRLASVAALFALLVPATTAFAATAQQSFSTPDEAAHALIEAARAHDNDAMGAILGKDSAVIEQDGNDPGVAAIRDRFVEAADQVLLIQKNTSDNVSLIIGPEAFIYPVPLVRKGKRWSFDSVAGAEELANRRVGLNELMTMTVLEDLPRLQREYEEAPRDGSNIRTYAQTFLSDTGKHNGLYWDAAEGEPQSPLGPMLKGTDTEVPSSYYGYNYRMLTSQGAAAPGGAYDYLVNGNLIGGFAAIAVPYKYGETGIMTFIVNRNGVVYQKDLGADTVEAAKAITSFNPDSGWTLARDVVAETAAKH